MRQVHRLQSPCAAAFGGTATRAAKAPVAGRAPAGVLIRLKRGSPQSLTMRILATPAAALALWAVLAQPATAQGPAPVAGSPVASDGQSLLHHRHRAKRTRRAQADSTTLLQVEAGYDGDFRAPDLARDQSSTLSVVVTPHPRLELQVDLDFWASQAAWNQRSVHGRGDTHLTGQWTLRPARPGRVAVGLAYDVKLPTASPDSLGSGRVDHRLLSLFSLASGRLEIDVAAGIDENGRPGGLTSGTEGAVTLTATVLPNVSIHAGASGQTADTDQPAGYYASGGATWQVTPLLALDLGGRLGLSTNAPVYGLTAGVTAPVFRP